MHRLTEFQSWPKIPRWNKSWTITEKVDGTNSHVVIDEVGDDYPPRDAITLVRHGDTTYGVRAASRNRWISPNQTKMDGTAVSDNFGFAAWVSAHAEQLIHLGVGRHYGEWYGAGIQRGYGLDHRRWALFDPRWHDELPTGLPAGVHPVPLIASCDGPDLSAKVAFCLDYLDRVGSHAVPGRRAEGIVIQSTVDRGVRFKALLDDKPAPAVVR